MNPILTCAVGLQFGDEGKGKIVDYLAEDHDIVVRFSGGANAGHTLYLNDQKFVFHLIPSGILHPHVTCVLGEGMVIDLAELQEEMRPLSEDQKARILISENAFVVMPEDIDEDRKNNGHLGTTGRGIGVAYRNKVYRKGLRVKDVINGVPSLKKNVCDTTDFLLGAMEAGNRILFEGAQGALLDIQAGIYPWVSSSSCLAANAFLGSGIPPHKMTRTIGIAKAYTTRVGEGPFLPLIQDKEVEERLRQAGKEFGATTSRPRKCGWIDIPALKYAIKMNGCDSVALTKLDILKGFPLGIITGYEVDGKTTTVFKNDLDFSHAKPNIELMPTFYSDISSAEEFEDLSPNARDFVERVEELIDVPIDFIGVGPNRHQLIEVY